MPDSSINLGPVTITAENIGWYGYIRGPVLHGYYGQELEWSLAFPNDIEGLVRAHGVWFSFRAMEIIGRQQADTIQRLSAVVKELQDSYEEAEKQMVAEGASAQELENLQTVIAELQKHQQLVQSQNQFGGELAALNQSSPPHINATDSQGSVAEQPNMVATPSSTENSGPTAPQEQAVPIPETPDPVTDTPAPNHDPSGKPISKTMGYGH